MSSLLTRREAALYLRVSVSWLARGGGPQPIRMGEIVRYDQKDLDLYLTACKSPTVCHSTNAKALMSGGLNLTPTASVIEKQQVSEIAAKLKSKSDAYARKHSLRPPLPLKA